MRLVTFNLMLIASALRDEIHEHSSARKHRRFAEYKKRAY